eukprot:scaffold39718_cov153-Amphora_coffeaeformis.AAC.1
MTWYRGQSSDVQNIILAGMVFFAIYIAFGLQNTFQPAVTRPTRGNYGQGNAYEQFYRQRRASSSSYYDDPYSTHSQRHTYSQHHNYNDYDHDVNYGYSGRRSSYWGSTGGDLLPLIIRISGVALVCYFAGINPMHALMAMNVVGGRRGRMFGRGFGGGFGGYGGRFRRPRRPGGFYW